MSERPVVVTRIVTFHILHLLESLNKITLIASPKQKSRMHPQAAMLEPDDEFRRLVKRSQAGDADATAQLVQKYEKQILIVARARLGRALRPLLDSVDLAQSINRMILEGLHNQQFDFSTPNKLVNLAIKLLTRKLAQHWRDLRRQQRVEVGNDWMIFFESVAGREPDPSQNAAGRDLVNQVLASLDEAETRLLELYMDGYTQIEIAEKLSIAHTALRTRLSRLRQRLKMSGLLVDWLYDDDLDAA
jgi:RNA polymerase sigma factor (sigma-70 family)